MGMHVCRLSVCREHGSKSRIDRPGKTKKWNRGIAHGARDSDTTFKVKRSKVNLQGAWEYCGGLPHSLLEFDFSQYTVQTFLQLLLFRGN